MKRKLFILAAFSFAIGVVGFQIGKDGHSSYSPQPGVFVERVDQLSSGRVLSMGWVNDADGDGYPEIVVHERPTRGFVSILRDWWTSSSTRASWVKLRSGRNGEVLQQLYGSGDAQDTLRAAFGPVFLSGRLGAWRVLKRGGLELTDGSQSLHEVKIYSGGWPDWTKHPGTSELIQVRPAADGVDLLGADSIPFRVESPHYLQTLIWSRHFFEGKHRWILMLGFSLQDSSEEGHSLVFLDWEDRRYIREQRKLSTGVLADQNGWDWAITLRVDTDGVPHAVQLWDQPGAEFTPVRIREPHASMCVDPQRALFITKPNQTPCRLVYWDLQSQQPIWEKNIGDFGKQTGIRDLSMSTLADHNGDGIDEIALTANFKASTWLALKFSESAMVAIVLDGATGELLTPQD